TAIDRRDFEYAAAYVVPEKRALVPHLERAGVEVTCLGATSRGDRHWAWRLRQLLLERPTDVVHAHSPLVAAGSRNVAPAPPPPVRPITLSTHPNIWSPYALPTRI